MDKIIFILNPVAGKGKGIKANTIIRDYLSKFSLSAEIVLTKKHKHAIEIASQLNSGYKKVISVGGDGTLNEVINGLDLSVQREIGVLPIGSGNDFATSLKMKKNIISNLQILLNAITNTKKVDIGLVEYNNFPNKDIAQNSRFINSLGFGFDAYVAYLNQTNKILSGIASYIVAVLKALKRFKSTEIEYVIDNINKHSGKKLLLAVGNSQTTGGGFYLTPDAEINDGIFDICVIDDMPISKLLISLPKALINKIKGVPEVHLDRFFNTLNVSIKNEGFFVHCDGENISDNISSATVSILQHKLNFITC